MIDASFGDVPLRHSAERHWRPARPRRAAWRFRWFRLGTQPKGIGDLPLRGRCQGEFQGVPLRHSAERHWRLMGCGSFCFGFGVFRLGTQPKGIGDLPSVREGRSRTGVPLRHSAERHWRRCSFGQWIGVGSSVPLRHSAERHWRPTISIVAYRVHLLLFRLGTQPKGIGDYRSRRYPPHWSDGFRLGTQPKGIGDPRMPSGKRIEGH